MALDVGTILAAVASSSVVSGVVSGFVANKVSKRDTQVKKEMLALEREKFEHERTAKQREELRQRQHATIYELLEQHEVLSDLATAMRPPTGLILERLDKIMEAGNTTSSLHARLAMYGPESVAEACYGAYGAYLALLQTMTKESTDPERQEAMRSWQRARSKATQAMRAALEE